MTEIQADPDDLERHGKAFDGHVADMSSVHDELYALLAGDIGIGNDDFSRGFRENYVTQVRNLADNVRDARDGVQGISLGMVKMAADYRATDDASLRGVTNLGSGLGLPPSTGTGSGSGTGIPHTTPHPEP
ncbi:hypothetical protein ABH935_004795 [Catenulispora sp. GAS73]|uniref:WXG100 family type VII secretion target n=1 Tax=Catenulispora sp. GAS73 TaxID=3156269 RepID=UPI0035191FCD